MKFKLFTRMLLVTLLVTSCGKDPESGEPSTNPPAGNEGENYIDCTRTGTSRQ